MKMNIINNLTEEQRQLYHESPHFNIAIKMLNSHPTEEAMVDLLFQIITIHNKHERILNKLIETATPEQREIIIKSL